MGWGIIEMAFVCPPVRPSVCLSVTLSWPLHISWTLWKIFIKLWSKVCLSESMCRTHKSTMPTQHQGHGFEPWISCPLHISYTPGRTFFKFWSYVCLSETMCRTHNSTMPTQGQGHGSRSHVWALNFVSALYLLYQWKIFFKLWSNVHLSETICSINNSTMPTQGHSSRSWVWAFNFVSALYLLYPWEDFL